MIALLGIVFVASSLAIPHADTIGRAVRTLWGRR